ncbi:hypothetical protein [Trinickia diaoshuihuensis]|uniref:hypothetical protein n=1 Tax=Trinickia diaoshuihuensis TaxID=2292265 RepID=UPI000E2577F3|nr:hypothetical protein [Trinickia diaoshuihuensis]
MKIVGYCALWSVALALLLAMCMILKEGHIDRRGATDSDVAAAGKVTGSAPATSTTPKPISRAALPTV